MISYAKKELVQPVAEISTEIQKIVSEKQEPVGPPVVVEEPKCNVGMSVGMTKNLGDYNSLKVSVSLFMPCAEVDIDKTFNFVKEWVDNKMNLLVDQIDS